MDIISDILPLPDLPEVELRVETRRFGPFRFFLGLDIAALRLAYQRVEDAHARFSVSPLSQVANRLEREVLASSVFGTNTIEGGTLTEEETQQILDLNPELVAAEAQRRAVNIKAAYDFALAASADPNWTLDKEYICGVHSLITDKLSLKHNIPGVFRDNPEGVITEVGDSAHGGRYRPPQNAHDILSLIDGLVAWHARLAEQKIPALIRAPLVHYYFERIHPFWDGNGRVGRVLEATILLAAGYRYAPFALARFYLEHIDRYFTLFNACRKTKSDQNPNTRFVALHLEGMLVSINRLHDRVNELVLMVLYDAEINQRYWNKQINQRQYAILNQLLDKSRPLLLSELRRAPWYVPLYARLTEKTKQRDLSQLRSLKLIYVDNEDRVWPWFAIKAKEKK